MVSSESSESSEYNSGLMLQPGESSKNCQKNDSGVGENNPPTLPMDKRWLNYSFQIVFFP